MQSRRAAFSAVALAAGLVLTQQACDPAGERSGTPGQSVQAGTGTGRTSTAAFPGGTATGGTATGGTATGGSATGGSATGGGATGTPHSAASGNPILAGERQVVIRPHPSSGAIVAVDGNGRLGLTDGEAEYGLFVLTPVGAEYQIRTAKADAGGAPACLGVKHHGAASLTVVAAACDTGRAGQLFSVTRQKTKDGQGGSLYAISSQGAFLQVTTDGTLIAEERGDAPLRTTFSLVDNGPAT